MKCTYPKKDCKSRAVKLYGPDNVPMCRAHAVKSGLVDDSFRIAKCKRGLYDTNKERERRGKVVGSKLKEIIGLDALLGIDPSMFDLEKEYPLIAAARLLPNTDKGDQKYALMMWLVANQETRQPQDLEGVSGIINIPTEEIQSWLRSREFVSVFQLQRKRFMQTRGRLVDVILLTKCLAGERWAIELFYDRFMVSDDIGVTQPKNLPLRKLSLTATEYDREVLPKPSDAKEVKLKSVAARALAAHMAQSVIESCVNPKEEKNGEEGIYEPVEGEPGEFEEGGEGD